MTPEQIIAIASGPGALSAFLVFLIFRERTDHQKDLVDERARHEKQLTDERARSERDIADERARTTALLVENRAQTTANERLADAFEKLVIENATLPATLAATLATAFDRMVRRQKP